MMRDEKQVSPNTYVEGENVFLTLAKRTRPEYDEMNVWAGHLIASVQSLHDRMDKHDPLYQDIVNLLDSINCLPHYMDRDRATTLEVCFGSIQGAYKMGQQDRGK